MRLTTAIKDSIVNAVMHDTPVEFSYDRYADAAMKIAVSKLPAKVRAVYDDKSLRHFVNNVPYNGIYLPITQGDELPEVDELREKFRASERARTELRRHVHNVVYQFSTDKQMIAAIPELEKYIPKEAVKTQNLPATNLIADLVKAGWPKAS